MTTLTRSTALSAERRQTKAPWRSHWMASAGTIGASLPGSRIEIEDSASEYSASVEFEVASFQPEPLDY